MSENPQTEPHPNNGRLCALLTSFSCGLLAVCLGCIESPPAIDPAVLSAHRGRLFLAEEPVDAMSVLEVRELFAAGVDETPDETPDETVGEHQEVVVVGKIGGMPNPWTDTEPDFPFKKDSATLFLVDAATTEKFDIVGHGHEEHVDCPFCARAAAENIDAIAVVNFVDQPGQVVPIAAQPLLELSELATIVIHGKARLVGGKMLVIDSDGVYVRE